MINLISGTTLRLEVDPNPNGLPILFFHFKYGPKRDGFVMFGKDNVEELIKELQEKLKEM